MNSERNNPFFSAREAEIMLEPQSHVEEIRNQIDRLVTDLRREIYLSPGKEEALDGDSLLGRNWMSEGLGNYPIVTNFGVRVGEGNMATLEIGASRFSDLPSEEPIEYYVSYEALDKLIFINESAITSVPKSSIESPTKIPRTKAGNVRREMVSPVDFALMRSALDAVEHKKVISPDPSYSISK